VSADLVTLDRRIYSQLSEDGSPVGGPAQVVLAVAMSGPAESEDDMAAWYTEEHIPMLLEVPGWRRPPYPPLDRLSARTARRIIATSESVAAALVEHHHVPRAKVVTIPNRPDPRDLARTRPREAVRRELGVPTVMNVLGPLANPAGAGRQIVGVAEPDCRDALKVTSVQSAAPWCSAS